jgi:hypothetical protein
VLNASWSLAVGPTPYDFFLKGNNFTSCLKFITLCIHQSQQSQVFLNGTEIFSKRDYQVTQANQFRGR